VTAQLAGEDDGEAEGAGGAAGLHRGLLSCVTFLTCRYYTLISLNVNDNAVICYALILSLLTATCVGATIASELPRGGLNEHSGIRNRRGGGGHFQHDAAKHPHLDCGWELRTAPRIGRKHRIYVESIAELAGISEERVNAILDTLERRGTGGTINEPAALVGAAGL
jgi:hypothetical protein